MIEERERETLIFCRCRHSRVSSNRSLPNTHSKSVKERSAHACVRYVVCVCACVRVCVCVTCAASRAAAVCAVNRLAVSALAMTGMTSADTCTVCEFRSMIERKEEEKRERESVTWSFPKSSVTLKREGRNIRRHPTKCYSIEFTLSHSLELFLTHIYTPKRTYTHTFLSFHLFGCEVESDDVTEEGEVRLVKYTQRPPLAAHLPLHPLPLSLSVQVADLVQDSMEKLRGNVISELRIRRLSLSRNLFWILFSISLSLFF